MLSSTRLTLARVFQCGTVCAALLVLVTRAHADDGQNHFDAGVKLYNAHNTNAALDEFNLALKTSPKDATVLRWIGFLELERQNYAAARDPLERAVELDPNSVVAHLDLGNVYDGLKLYPKALEEFRKVTRLKPDSTDAYYDLGLTQTKMGRWADAAESLGTAARLDSASAKSGGGIREDPAIQDALGYALMNSSDTRGAVTAYQKAVTLVPGNADYNYHLGLAWRRKAEEKKGQPEVALGNARRAVRVAVERTPGNYEFTELYGEILFDLNTNTSLPEAVDQFSRAAELDKTQYNPVYNLAIANARMGRYSDAEKAYARALTLVKPGDDPSFRRSAISGLSTSLLKQKKYDDAITNLKMLTTEFPSDTGGWVNLSTAYRFRGDETGQIEALRGALANSSGYANVPQLRAVLGALYYRRGDGRAALEQYSGANRAQPNNADFLNGLALSEQKVGRLDDAIRDFQAAIKANPRFADAYNNLGVAYNARYDKSSDKADLDRAVNAYSQALAIDPRHPLALKNKARYDKSKRP